MLMEGNVAISHQALEQVFTDSVEAGDIEVGGLLIGYPTEKWTVITRAIPTSRGTITRIPITSEEMARAAEKLLPGEKIMGWYHSHPGHTVFFSQDDVESHERFLQFNPRFQALVIDPHQAKRGDPVADCVKFYTVKDHKVMPIHDYRITGSSSHAYNPRYFTFDKYGFPYHNPAAGYRITAADDRELRQTLKMVLEDRDDLISEMNKLESENEELSRRINSNFSVSRKLFSVILLLLILIPFLFGLGIGYGIQKVSEDINIESVSEDINIEGVFIDKNSDRIFIIVNLGNIQDKELNKGSLSGITEVVFENNKEVKRFSYKQEKVTVLKRGERLLIEISLEESELQQLLSECEYIQVSFTPNEGETLLSGKFLFKEK